MQSFRIATPLLISCRNHVSRPGFLFSASRWPAHKGAVRSFRKQQSATQAFKLPSSHLSVVSCSAETNENSGPSEQSQAPAWPSRNAYCGKQTLQQEGKRLELCGWVHRARNMGGIVFADLRDHSGILQVSFLLSGILPDLI